MHINTLRIGRLGISAYMYPSDNRTHKYVDWALLSSTNPKLNASLASLAFIAQKHLSLEYGLVER